MIVAHADRTAKDHALRDTVLHVGRQIDDFTAFTTAYIWYEDAAPEDCGARQGYVDLAQIPLPDGVQVFTCGPLPFMRDVRPTLLTRGVPPSPDPLGSVRHRPVGRAGPPTWHTKAHHPTPTRTEH